MYIPFAQDPPTVGREDRLVRGCVALSLLLLGGFALLASGGIEVIPVLFLLASAYATASSLTGCDPLYTSLGIDTRTDVELGIRTPRDEAPMIDFSHDPGEAAVLHR